MKLVQSFISIAEAAAQQQTDQLNADSNFKAQHQSKQLKLDSRFNDLVKVKESQIGDKSA
jgi:hypothetical protein